MPTLSVAQRPFFDDSVEHTIDRSRPANRTATAAHHVVDALADQALTGVGKVSGSLHTAVNHAADAVIQTADWVAQVPVQVRQKRIKLAHVAFATIASIRNEGVTKTRRRFRQRSVVDRRRYPGL